MNFKTNWLSVLFLFFLCLPSFEVEAADSREPLPEADNPFWEVMSQINRPDDLTCTSKAAAILTSKGIPGGTERAELTCRAISLILTSMQTTFNQEGIATNLFTEDDWHHIDGLYFEELDGRIEFTKELDFMSRNFMLLLENLTERLDFEKNEITFDADVVNGMRDTGAIVTMRSVSDFSVPEILVDGEKDFEGVVSGMVYDKVSGTIIFNAAHFTTFTAVEKGSYGKPKISKIIIDKFYTSTGKEKIRVSIKGKRFDKKVKIKLGSVSAYSVHWKNKNKVVAYFSVKEVLEKAGDQTYLKVKNINKSQSKFKKKINILTLVGGKNKIL